MATTKVSALSALTAPDGAEELLINDGGTSKKITITNVSKLNLKGGDLTSASPLVIDTDGNYFDVTGTTNFAVMTVAANRQFTLQFDAVLTMTHNGTALDLPSEANITTAAGDVATFQSTGANTVQCINYTRADGTAVVAAGYTLPEANATTKGGIELFSNTDQSVAATAVSTTASRTYGLQLNSDGQGVVNVPWVDTDTNTTYSAGSSSALGVIKIEDDATQTTAASSITTTAARTYGLQLNSSNQGVVNVPWVDTNTTYSVTDGELSQINFTSADHTKLNAIEASADVTDATNVTAAGALMDSELAGIAAVKATTGTFLSADESKLDAVEASADVTDATNVASAGAGMLTVDQSWSGSQRGTPSTVTDGTLDLDTANNFQYTPAGADVFEFTNEEAGQSGFVKLINPSAHAISVGSEVKKGASWDVSTAGTYLVSYYTDGTNVYVSASEALS